MQKNLADIKNLSQKVKNQAQATKTMISQGKWDETMRDLVAMLEEAARDSGVIRGDLERISVDLNQLKAEIEAMIAHANHQYNVKMQEMADAISREERRVEETKNCFKNWKRGFMTIISGGVTCILQDQELKKLRRNRDNLKNARRQFEGDVGP